MQLLPQNGSQPVFGNWRILQNRTAKGFVDRSLIADAFGFRFFTKRLDYLSVQHDGDTLLSRRLENRATLAFAEVIFLTHDIASPRSGWPCERK